MTLAHVEQHASRQLLKAWKVGGDDPRHLEGATVFDNYGNLGMVFVPACPTIHAYPPYLARRRAAQLRAQAAAAQAEGGRLALVADLLQSADRLEEEASIEEHRGACC